MSNFKLTDWVSFTPDPTIYGNKGVLRGVIRELYDNHALVKVMHESGTNETGLVFFKPYHYLVSLTNLTHIPNENHTTT